MNPDQPIITRNYNLLVKNGMNHFINTEINLLEMYKSALISGSKSIAWEKGVIDLDTVCGIIDNTYYPPSMQA